MSDDLAEILAQLKQEPEWTEAAIGVKGIISNSDAVRQHNATRTRLLAVVEALENVREDYVLPHVTAKLAAALEETK